MKWKYNLYEKHPWLLGLIALAVGSFTGYQIIIKIQNFHHLVDKTIRVSSPEGGSYHQVLNTFYRFAYKEGESLGFLLDLRSIDSGGSLETIDQIGTGKVDVGLVQGNTTFQPNKARALLEIYPEIYLFFTPREHKYLNELLSQFQANDNMIKVASIGRGSQVYEDVFEILGQYGIEKKRILHASMNYLETEDALEKNKIDLALIVGGYSNPIVISIAQNPSINLLGMDKKSQKNLIEKPGLFEYTIRPGQLGGQAPKSEINTLTTPATLVAGTRLKDAMLHKLMGFLLSRKSDLKKELTQLDIKQLETEEDILHPVARKYRRTSSLTFFQQRETMIRLTLELGAFFISLGSLLYQFCNKMLNNK